MTAQIYRAAKSGVAQIYGLAQVQAQPRATHVTFSVVKDFAGTPADDVSGLDYAIYESLRINANALPIKVGSDLAIVGGIVTLNIAGVTTLFPGGTVRVSYGPADGGFVASALVTVT